MTAFNAIVNRVFDLLLLPLRGAGAWAGIALVSLVTALIVLLITKAASRGTAVQRAKRRAQARILEMLLFKDDPWVTLGALSRTAVANAAYVGSLLPAVCLSIVPVLLVFVQASTWFSDRPLRAGETALVKARFNEHTPVMARVMHPTG